MLHDLAHLHRFPGVGLACRWRRAKLIPVVNGGAGNSWVGGWLDWTTASDNTNTINLASDSIALIAPYLALNH